MPELEIFDLWRWMLTVVVTIYVTIYTWKTVWGYLLWFNSSRRFQVMGRYALVLLLRSRFHKFAGELARIAALVVLFAVIVGLHWYLV